MKLVISILMLVMLACVTGLAVVPAQSKVTLRAECSVPTGEVVRLRDVADISAPAALKTKLGETVISTAPYPGQKRSIGAGYIRAKINSLDSSAKISLLGADSVKLEGKCVRLSSDDLTEEAKQYLTSILPQDGRTYEVTVQRAPRELVFADGANVEIRPRTMTSTVRPGPNSVAIDAVVDGKVAASTSVTLEVKAVAQIMVTTTEVKQGEAISSANTTWELRDITRMQNPITQDSETKNWVARRSIRAGVPVTSSDVKLPADVHKGDAVTLVVRCGNVVLRATGEAKADARVGELVSVKTQISNEEVHGRVSAPGTVEIVR